MASLPPTFVKGFHDESKVKKLTYKNVLGTDMLVSNVGMGAAAFGETCEILFSYRTNVCSFRKILPGKTRVRRGKRDTFDCPEVWSECCRYSTMVWQYKVWLKPFNDA